MNTENKKPENPPAFPKTDVNAEGMILAKQNQGMTLRDYFANAAMQSFTNIWYEDAKNNPESIARKSYNLADAMLKQREL